MNENLPADFTISAVGPADFEDWVELALELWPPEDDSDREDMRKTMTEILNAENQMGCLVRNAAGDTLAKPLLGRIAFMNLSLRRDYVAGATQSPVAFVEGIYVRAPYRHQKVGTALMQWAEQWAQQQGCVELASGALIENQDSYQFHTKVGFEEVERVVCFIKPLE